jgi:hypothetical protein
LLDLGKKLDAEAKRIEEAILELENPIVEQINAEETRLHNEAAAREAAERQRVELLEARLEALQLMQYDAQGLPSAKLLACVDEARNMVIGDDWQEFKEKAERAKIAAVAALEGMHAKAVAAEAEAELLVKERAELERFRAEQAERDRIERERVAAEQKAESERLAKERAELHRLDAERAAKAKAEQDRIAAENLRIRIEQEAEAARIAAERRKLDEERAAAERERLAREAAQQTQAERETAYEEWLAANGPDVFPKSAWMAACEWCNDNR